MIISGYSMNEATEDSILSDPFFNGKRTIKASRINNDELKTALSKHGFKHLSHVHYLAAHSKDVIWFQFSNGKEYVSIKYVMVPESQYTIKVSKSIMTKPKCPNYAEEKINPEYSLSHWSIEEMKSAGIY